MATQLQPTAIAPVPYDYDTAETAPNWRSEFAWPVAHRLSFDCSYRALESLLAVARRCEDQDLRDIALLSLGMVFNAALPSLEAALVVERKPAHQLLLTAKAPEVAFLRGETEAVPPARDIGAFRAVQEPPMALARRFARTRSWTPWTALPMTFLSPDVVAISHNGLLREAVGESRVRFHHADSLFAKFCGDYRGAGDTSRCVELGARYAEALLSAYPLSPEIQERTRRVIEIPIAEIVGRAAKDIAALRQVRRLPDTIWAGTGGSWPGRALAIEVLRRGGAVRRFDHGGGVGLNDLSALWVAAELCVSSAFTSPTPALADRVSASNMRDYWPLDSSFALSGGGGDPLHRSASRIRRTPNTDGRRVTYTPVSLLGYSQRMPPRLPDLVNLDWQMRFAELLSGLPIDLTCRPHPVGLFSNRPNPLADIVPLSPRVFEDLIADTDVFVFDYIQSTTFYEALCTDRPIVLIDFGLPVYTGDMRAQLEARCRIVPAQFDDRNRPHVDADQLADAICGGTLEVDPTPFRSLLAGEDR